MKTIDQLLFRGEPIKGKSIEELYKIIEHTYNYLEMMSETLKTDTEIKHQMRNPIYSKPDEEKKARVWVEKLHSWLLIPKKLDIQQQEVYILRVIERAKKFKKLAKTKKVDIMPLTKENKDE